MISIGYIVGTSVAAVLTVAAVVAAFRLAAWRRRELASNNPYGEAGLARGFTILAVAAAVAVVVGWVGIAWPPLDMDYHRYSTVTGTVTSVEKRLVSDGEGMSEKYVVQLEGDTQQYGCLDTRCSAIKENEDVELSCLRVWAWYGSDGFDCEYITAGGRT